MKLEQQYQALHQAYADRQPAQPGLAELCALWKCSERNARLQLAKMRARGWLSWEPGRGRGRKSRLSLLCRPEQLEWERLQHLLRDGKLEQAFAQLPPQRREQLLSALPQYLGSSAQGRCLRIPIPHAPLSLDPITVSGRLESHLVRQIFDRLCRFDRALQSLQGGLAHYWKATPRPDAGASGYAPACNSTTARPCKPTPWPPACCACANRTTPISGNTAT